MTMKRKQVLASDFRLKGRKEAVIARNGEYNASDKKDLLKVVAHVMEAMGRGTEILSEEQASQKEQSKKVNRELVQAMFQNDEAHAELGATIAESLQVSANREGFLRRVLAHKEISQGQRPELKLRMKNVIGSAIASPTKVEPQIMRDKTFWPTEFDIVARPFVENREIEQSQDDVLEEKFIEAQEAIMVQEDRLLISAANSLVGMENDQTIVTGGMNFASITAVMKQIRGWNLPVSKLLVASDLIDEMLSSQSIAQLLDPVSQHEILQTGTFARIYGMDVISDATRHEPHRVIKSGEFFVFTSPEFLGAYTDRNGISSNPITISEEKIPGRGWVLHELFSAAIVNGRGVAKGVRI